MREPKLVLGTFALGLSLALTGCGGSGAKPNSGALPDPSSSTASRAAKPAAGGFCSNIKSAEANKDRILHEMTSTAEAGPGREGLDGMQHAMEKAYGLYLPVLAAAPAEIQPQAKLLTAAANKLLTDVRAAKDAADFGRLAANRTAREDDALNEAEDTFNAYVKAHCGVDLKEDAGISDDGE